MNEVSFTNMMFLKENEWQGISQSIKCYSIVDMKCGGVKEEMKSE